MSQRIEITFLRHGRSLADDEDKFEGRYDSPLTETGRAQARLRAQGWLEKGIRYDQAIASTLSRARESAEIVTQLLECPLEFDAEWMELDHGPLAGLSRELADRIYPRPAFRGPFERVAGSGESEIDLSIRAAHALQKVIQRGPGRYLVVAHGGVINAALRIVCGSPPPVNGAGIWFTFGDLGYVLVHYDPGNHKWIFKEMVPGIQIPS